MSTLVERLAELAKGVGVSSVYAEATELNGVHVMPVALSFHAFGAGEEPGPEQHGGERDAGGGFAASVPIGAYVRDIRGLRFAPNPITALVALVPVIGVTGCALKGLLRVSKKKNKNR